MSLWDDDEKPKKEKRSKRKAKEKTYTLKEIRDFVEIFMPAKKAKKVVKPEKSELE